MRNIVVFAISLFIAVVFAAGCTTHHVIPEAKMIEPDVMPKLAIQHPVNVMSELKNKDDKDIVCDVGIREYWSTYNDLTNTAVAVARDALEKNNVTIDENAEKRLTLAIEDVNCEVVQFEGIFYTAILNVQTGNGLVKKFEGKQTHGHDWGTPWAVEVSMTYAVIEMLKDPDILEYLKR